MVITVCDYTSQVASADATYVFVAFDVGFYNSEILYFAAVCTKQPDIVATCVNNAQSADSLAIAVEIAAVEQLVVRTVIIADRCPLQSIVCVCFVVF